MGKQYNKVEKRARRKRYIARVKLRRREGMKKTAKTASASSKRK